MEEQIMVSTFLIITLQFYLRTEKVRNSERFEGWDITQVSYP